MHCDGSGPKTTCRRVSGDFQYANGVLLTEDGKTLVVNDLYEGTAIVFSVDPSTKDLLLQRKIVSPTPAGLPDTRGFPRRLISLSTASRGNA